MFTVTKLRESLRHRRALARVPRIVLVRARLRSDRYESIPAALRFMVDTLSPEQRRCVVDPCGNGFSQAFLRFILGLRVYAGMVVNDVFAIHKLPEWVSVVTNPPFSLKEEIILHLLKLGVSFRMILPALVLQRVWFNKIFRAWSTRREFTVYTFDGILKYHVGGVLEPGARWASIVLAVDLAPVTARPRDLKMLFAACPQSPAARFEVRDKKRLGQPIVTPTPTPAAAAAVAAAAANATGE